MKISQMHRQIAFAIPWEEAPALEQVERRLHRVHGQLNHLCLRVCRFTTLLNEKSPLFDNLLQEIAQDRTVQQLTSAITLLPNSIQQEGSSLVAVFTCQETAAFYQNLVQRIEELILQKGDRCCFFNKRWEKLDERAKARYVGIYDKEKGMSAYLTLRRPSPCALLHQQKKAINPPLIEEIQRIFYASIDSQPFVELSPKKLYIEEMGRRSHERLPPLAARQLAAK